MGTVEVNQVKKPRQVPRVRQLERLCGRSLESEGTTARAELAQCNWWPMRAFNTCIMFQTTSAYCDTVVTHQFPAGLLKIQKQSRRCINTTKWICQPAMGNSPWTRPSQPRVKNFTWAPQVSLLWEYQRLPQTRTQCTKRSLLWMLIQSLGRASHLQSKNERRSPDPCAFINLLAYGGGGQDAIMHDHRSKETLSTKSNTFCMVLYALI